MVRYPPSWCLVSHGHVCAIPKLGTYCAIIVRCQKNLCPQSPRAKFLRNFSKRSAKNAAKFWRNFSQIFVLQFPGKMAAKNFTKNPRHFPRCTKLSFFTAATLGASGPKKNQARKSFAILPLHASHDMKGIAAGAAGPLSQNPSKRIEIDQRILVAQCSATPATVPATPPCSATPFQTQISVRHLPGMGGGKARHQNF